MQQLELWPIKSTYLDEFLPKGTRVLYSTIDNEGRMVVYYVEE